MGSILSLGHGGSIFGIGYLIFDIWMFIDAIRRKEYTWAVLVAFGLGFWYFLNVYRDGSSSMRGFELPGTQSRKRIRELQAQIHHLNNAHHYFQLGDVYFRQGKLAKAEAAYRSSLERDPTDIDARGHLGQCLLRQKKAAEAQPLLAQVCRENPKHDFGYSMMALAEATTALGDPTAALPIWQQVTANNAYARAKTQLAELYINNGNVAEARRELADVIHDDLHAPRFQRRRDRVWVRRARALQRRIR